MHLYYKQRINWNKFYTLKQTCIPRKSTKAAKHVLLLPSPKVNLSSSIEHSTKLYNQILSTHSNTFNNSTQRSNTSDASTQRIYLKEKASQVEMTLERTEVFLNHPHSRNNNNSSLYDYRVESISQFTQKIKQKRINHLYNTIATDILAQKFSVNDNAKESLDMTISGYVTTRHLLGSFMSNYRLYCSHISKEIDRENDKRNKLKLQLNALKAEIERLKAKAGKLRRCLEHYMQIKLLLLCVRNKAMTSEGFCKEDAVEHEKDEESYRFIMSDYTVTLPVKKVKSFQRKSILVKKASCNFCSNESTKKQMLNDYHPKVNKDVFGNVEDFNRVFNELTERLSFLLNESNNRKGQVALLKKTALETRKHYAKEEEGFLQLNKIIEAKEKELEQMKKRNAHLIDVREKMPNAVEDSLPQLRKKIQATQKRLINEGIQCGNGGSQSVDYLKAIELKLNYLIAQQIHFEKYFKASYSLFKAKIDKKNQRKQSFLQRRNEEQATMRKLLRIRKNASKLYYLPRRKLKGQLFVPHPSTRNISKPHHQGTDYQEFLNTYVTDS